MKMKRKQLREEKRMLSEWQEREQMKIKKKTLKEEKRMLSEREREQMKIKKKQLREEKGILSEWQERANCFFEETLRWLKTNLIKYSHQWRMVKTICSWWCYSMML